MKIYIDGKFYDEENAKVSVFDHGYLYGDGVFEGIRIYNGKIFKRAEHVKRLYESAKAISLDIGMSQSEMEDTLEECVRMNQKKDGYIRLVVSRGEGPLGIDPFKCPKPRVVIITGDIQIYPEELYKKGIAIMTSSYRRIPVQCLDSRVKSLNYMNNILAKIEAKGSGCQESLMLNTEGFVAECTADNIFTVKNGVLSTPAACHGALEGITRNSILEIAREMGIETSVGTLTRFDLYNADECFLTGTGAEVIPVTKVDQAIVGGGIPGAMTLKLIGAFRNYVK